MARSEIGSALSRRERNTLLESIGKACAVLVTASDGTIQSANANAETMLGYTESEMRGRSIAAFQSNTSTAMGRAAKDALARGEAVQDICVFQRKNGSICHAATRCYPIGNGASGLQRAVFVLTDTTERAASEENRAALLNAIELAQAVIEFEPDGTILTANENFCAAMGYALHEIVGKAHWMFADPETMTRDQYEQHWADLRAGKSASGEFKRRKADGSDIWINAIYAPIRDRTGRVCRVVKVASDCTALVKRRVLFETVGHDVAGRMSTIASSVSNVHQHAATASSAASDTAQMMEGAVQVIAQFEHTTADIAQSMTRSESAVRSVAEASHAADNNIAELSDAAGSMGSIVDLIQKIAGQINLLALNATIESARAGEAGRGFAVVASEVKSLADQVEKSTNQISSDIDRIQSVASSVVAGLKGIDGAVEEVSTSVSTASDAVAHLSASAREIADTMNTASASMRTIDQDLSQISDAIATADEEARESARLCHTLSDNDSPRPAVPRGGQARQHLARTMH